MDEAMRQGRRMGNRKGRKKKRRREEGRHLAFGVAKNNGLRNREGVVQIAQSVEFPFLLLDSNEELLDTFQRQFITLDQNCTKAYTWRTGGRDEGREGGRKLVKRCRRTKIYLFNPRQCRTGDGFDPFHK
jgi:hypothetical protein